MKSSRVLLAAGSVCLLLAALPVRANPGRAVFVRGKNYKVFIDSSGYITGEKIYYAYTADTPGSAGLETSCSAPGQNKMSVWVAVIDPWAEPPKVISNRAIGAVNINYRPPGPCVLCSPRPCSRGDSWRGKWLRQRCRRSPV